MKCYECKYKQPTPAGVSKFQCAIELPPHFLPHGANSIYMHTGCDLGRKREVEEAPVATKELK